jgi:hypothetical protein
MALDSFSRNDWLGHLQPDSSISLWTHAVFVFFGCRLIHKSCTTGVNVGCVNHKVTAVCARQAYCVSVMIVWYIRGMSNTLNLMAIVAYYPVTHIQVISGKDSPPASIDLRVVNDNCIWLFSSLRIHREAFSVSWHFITIQEEG